MPASVFAAPAGLVSIPVSPQERSIPLAWEPILEGKMGAAALRLVETIASDLVREASLSATPPFLAHGHAGFALLFAYLEEALPGRGFGNQAIDFLEQAMLGVSQAYAPEGLFAGFPGVAWAVEHLRADYFDSEEEDPCETIVSGLQDLLGQSPWQRHYDLISGLTGLGVYALERRPLPGGDACLDLVVRRLAETAEERGPGLTWLTPPETLPMDRRQRYSQGEYNLGMAHGVPGVIALLSRALAAGIQDAGRLLEGAVAWTLAQRLPDGQRSLFPYRVCPGLHPESSRLAWCYGDLGVAIALLSAARCAGQAVWETQALEIARFSASRTPQSAQVDDAGFCHGAVGLAHLFNRIYQASADEILLEAAIAWYECSLKMAQSGQGIGGYLFLTPQDQGSLRWTADSSFLTGAAGVALGLLAGATAIEPAWDRLLLVDLPAHQPVEPRGSSS